MYEAEIHLRQDKECVLSRLSRQVEFPLEIAIEELHEGNVTFVLDASGALETCRSFLAEDASVHRVEQLDDDRLLVTKRSCGAYSALHHNHGTLRESNQISHRRRVYNVLAFDRDSLQGIVSGFKSIGTVSVTRLTEVGSTDGILTDRQYEVVQYALDNGYFDWPRKRTGDELAADLDISRPTFLEHLRKAESKLLTDALDRERRGHDFVTN